jgi:L-rhamnose isomerase
MLCENEAVSTVQNNGRSTGGVTGTGFMPGQSGNPRGRPKGLAKATRELVGEDGMKLAQLWWDIAKDPMRRDSDRLEASKLLADRGWGKAASFEPVEGDPVDLAALEGAAEEFRRRILRLAEEEPEAT